MKAKFTAACCLFLLAGQVSHAQAPNISYPGPQTYTTGTPITPLKPVNTGGAVPANIYGQPTIYPGKGSDGIAVDASGNVYAVTAFDQVVRKITPAGVVSIFAGSGMQGSADGVGTAASFNYPTGIAIDASGNLFITDEFNSLIRKITPTGVVTTFAGNGMMGSADGVGSAASFNFPTGIALDVSGNLIVADTYNRLIRKISPAGVVTTVAGSGKPGSTDGVGTAASFDEPYGVATDISGNIYVSDEINNLIRKISPAGVVTTIAGGGIGNADGAGASASFSLPEGLATDALGNVYVADVGNYEIRKVSPAGIVSTLIPAGYSAGPAGIAADASGNLYVTDGINIKKIATTGYAVTPALPAGLTLDVMGIISGTPTASAAATYTITGYNTAGSSAATVNITVKTAALPIISYGGPQAYTTGRAIYLPPVNIGGAFTNCTLSPALPAGLSFDAATGIISGVPTAVSPAAVYTLTAYNSFGNSKATVNITVSAPVRAPAVSYPSPKAYTTGVPIPPLAPVNKGGAVPAVFYGQVSTFAGTGQSGATNGTAAGARFNSPSGVATDLAGNVYIADAGNNLIRKITPAGAVTTFAGSSSIGSTNGTGTAASFNNPMGIAVDATGNVYVADSENNLIRKITPAGVVSTLAGSGTAGAANGTGTAASFNNPASLAVDASGSVYVTDGVGHTIRKITPAGVVSALAGSGVQGSADGVGTAASFIGPGDVTIDAADNLYVIDGVHVRKITPAGVVSTLAGISNPVFISGGGPGNVPQGSSESLGGIVIGPTNNVYITDNIFQYIKVFGSVTSQIRQIDSAGVITTFAFLPSGSQSVGTPYVVEGLATDTSGNLYIADGGVRLILKAKTRGYSISPALPTGLKLDSLGTISGIPTAVSPATTYTITAYNSGGNSTATVSIAVLLSPIAPNITAISPGTGITGTTVTLTGTYFTGATAVSFGGVPAASFTINSATSITAVVGAGAIGDVTVTNPAGTGVFTGFTYMLVLPPTNYELTITSATCKGTADGSVDITAVQALNYTVTITGNGLNSPYRFISSRTISNLAAGTYNVCITVAGQLDYQQCFSVVITEPKDLSVYSVIDPVLNTVNLVLDGGTLYNITLNGTAYTTSGNTISLPLNAGINDLSVTTDRLCQGTVLRTINNSGKITPYPDPFQNTINLNLGLINVDNAVVEIHSAADGSLVYSKQYINQSGVLAIDVSNLKTGIYALKLSLNGFEKIFKIMKK